MNTPRRSKPARSVKRHARRSHSKPRRSHRRYSGGKGGPCPTGTPLINGCCRGPPNAKGARACVSWPKDDD